jgi:hypothetical protein
MESRKSELEKQRRSIKDKGYLSRHWLLAVSHQLLDVAGDGSAGQGDVLNAAADHIAICHRNNVGNTVSRIDDGSGQGTFFYLSKEEVSKEEKEGPEGLTLDEVQEAASARTAWTAIYKPGTLNVSNIISAVYSRFSGGFKGGSVRRT